MNDLVFIVIEKLGVPSGVISALALVEILVMRAVEIIKSVAAVFNGVGMNDVQKHGNAHIMRGVDEPFKSACVSEA